MPGGHVLYLLIVPIEPINLVLQQLRHRPPGVAQAVNRGGGSGLMLHRLGLRLHAQALGGLVPCRGGSLGSRARGADGDIRLRGALGKAAHIGAQLFQLGLGLIQRLVDGLGQTVQIQRGSAQTLVHAGQA